MKPFESNLRWYLVVMLFHIIVFIPNIAEIYSEEVSLFSPFEVSCPLLLSKTWWHSLVFSASTPSPQTHRASSLLLHFSSLSSTLDEYQQSLFGGAHLAGWSFAAELRNLHWRGGSWKYKRANSAAAVTQLGKSFPLGFHWRLSQILSSGGRWERHRP